MPSRNAATARQVWWASVPVWSIGFLSPVPFLIVRRFVSAEELCEYTQLSPDRVDELRDLMIFT